MACFHTRNDTSYTYVCQVSSEGSLPRMPRNTPSRSSQVASVSPREARRKFSASRGETCSLRNAPASSVHAGTYLDGMPVRVMSSPLRIRFATPTRTFTAGASGVVGFWAVAAARSVSNMPRIATTSSARSLWGARANAQPSSNSGTRTAAPTAAIATTTAARTIDSENPRISNATTPRPAPAAAVTTSRQNRTPRQSALARCHGV